MCLLGVSEKVICVKDQPIYFKCFPLKTSENHKVFWQLQEVYVVRCAVWYHLYNLKNVKNTYGGVLILVKYKWYEIAQRITYKSNI